MTTIDKLAVMKAVKRRNDETISSGFLKVQRLSNTVRVVIQPWFNGAYRIAAQQYCPDYAYSWEVNADGWHDTSAQFSSTFEGAKRVFEQKVREEQRWLERIV